MIAFPNQYVFIKHFIYKVFIFDGNNEKKDREVVLSPVFRMIQGYSTKFLTIFRIPPRGSSISPLYRGIKWIWKWEMVCPP